MRPLSLLTLAVLLSLASCTKDPDGPAEAGDGTDAETTSSTSETNGETGNDVCAEYVDELADPPLQITVTNTRSEPAYLMTPDDCTFNHVHVSGEAGHWPPGDCEPTCAQMIAGSCACPGACPAPQLLRIEAGGSYTLDWAFVLAPDSVPETCVDPNLCGSGDCPQAIAPPDGDYTISVDVLYAPAECADPSDPCACPPGESWCLTSAIVSGIAPDLDLDVMRALPDGPLELVIE